MKTHNGFVLEYNGPTFPPSASNAITYEWFCLRGGLANQRNYKVLLLNGRYSYHDISTL